MATVICYRPSGVMVFETKFVDANSEKKEVLVTLAYGGQRLPVVVDEPKEYFEFASIEVYAANGKLILSIPPQSPTVGPTGIGMAR